ncbi:MAG: S-layer homology domain-containing protein [Eubacteriales bacterium]
MISVRLRGKSRLLLTLFTVLFLWVQMGVFTYPTPALAAAQNPIYKDVYADPNVLFINYLKGAGLITGFPDGTFRPASGLTRAEAAAVLVKAAKLKTGSTQSGFKDVSPKYWAAASITAAKNAKLLSGYPGGTFRPEAKLTRAEGIALILKLSKQPDPGVALPTLADINSKHWAARPAAIGLAAGMVGLTSDNKRFLPDAFLTRGSLARALAVLLTEDPTLYETSLTNKLKVIKGTVTVTRADGKAPETIKDSTEIKLGDAINVGSASSAELVFPDGTGLRLEENTDFKLKEAKGRSYMKPDGTPGTSVEWLAVDLKVGKVFGALATRAETAGSEQAAETPQAGTAGFGRTRVTTAAASTVLPWWKVAKTKRTKVKIDMPTGVAAIRGTFWETVVTPFGTISFNTLTGEATLTAGGRTTTLAGEQRTEVTEAGAPPTPPAPLTTEDKQNWVALKEWAQERANEIQAVQEQELPPPAPAEKPDLPPPPPTDLPPDQQKPPVPYQLIADIIDKALKNAEQAVNPPIINSGGGGGTVRSIKPTAIVLNRNNIVFNIDPLYGNDSPFILYASIIPGDTTNKGIIWSTSDKTVATVVNGVVVPISAGVATITAASAADSNVTADCSVLVERSVP